MVGGGSLGFDLSVLAIAIDLGGRSTVCRVDAVGQGRIAVEDLKERLVSFLVKVVEACW